MADGFIHTVWKDGEWHNEVEGSGDRVPGDYSTKEEAVETGRSRARSRTRKRVANRHG